jgi:hypothetical protein
MMTKPRRSDLKQKPNDRSKSTNSHSTESGSIWNFMSAPFACTVGILSAKSGNVNPPLFDFLKILWIMAPMATKLQNSGQQMIDSMVEQAKKRREKALELSKAGHTMQEIGDKLGVSKQRAAELIYRARREAAKS